MKLMIAAAALALTANYSSAKECRYTTADQRALVFTVNGDIGTFSWVHSQSTEKENGSLPLDCQWKKQGEYHVCFNGVHMFRLASNDLLVMTTRFEDVEDVTFFADIEFIGPMNCN